LGIIGSGVQAYYQALYAASVRELQNIYVFDILADKCRDFAKLLQERLPKIKAQPAESAEELIKKSDIIVTVTPSSRPVIPDSVELLEGKHFVGIGSYKPTMQEYPRSIFQLLDKIYIDVDFAKEESGDLIIPCKNGWYSEEKIQTLYPAIQENSIERNKTTFYKSVGMALFDILVADNIYQKALERNIGQNIKL
jgi:ornithine cyclodeaminase